MKLTPEWVLVQVNFDPIQNTGPIVGGGHSFVSGLTFTRLQYNANAYFFYNLAYFPLTLDFQMCTIHIGCLWLFLCLPFLRPLQYTIPTVAATIDTPPMAAVIPIRMTIQKVGSRL